LLLAVLVVSPLPPSQQQQQQVMITTEEATHPSSSNNSIWKYLGMDHQQHSLHLSLISFPCFRLVHWPLPRKGL
jgi:hypothetical protein